MTTHTTHWTAAADTLLPDLVSLRRAIHREPELGLHNPMTLAKIKAALAGLPLTYREGPSTTGLMATLVCGSGAGRRVLLRGDTDALPLIEETGVEYTSEVSGAMHACGHDTHVAMLVGAARLLCAKRDKLEGIIDFMFQPGEEGYHGARFMLDDGLLDPLPDAAFALHVMPNAPHGLVAGRAGPLLASSDVMKIRVSGKGGHASMPHDSIDPIPVACAIVTAIQTMVTRTVSVFDPAVVTVAKIMAGTTNNIIPEVALMEGTIRTLSARQRAAVADHLQSLVPAIAAAHGCVGEIDIIQGFPVTVCAPAAAAFGEAVVSATFGAAAWRTMDSPIMGAEDFAYVLEKIPGAMFFLGASHEGDDWRHCCGLHSNHMVLDDSVMARGAALHAALAERFLAEGFGG